MAGHKGLINTSFYFGVGQERERSIVLGHGVAAFCVHTALQDKYGAASTDLCFVAPNRGAVMLAALLKVINKKKQFNGSGHFAGLQAYNLLYCVKYCLFSLL